MLSKAGSTWRPSPPPVSREDCTICQGTGWELVNERGVSRARPCSCRALDRLIRMKDRVRIPQCHEHCTLDNYEPANFSQTRALCEARAFVQKYPWPGRDIFFAGGPGVGKTHLAVGILREIMPKLAEDALFIDFIDLCRAMESGSHCAGLSQAAWERVTLAPVLVLDNFGMVTPGREILALAVRLVSVRWKAHRPAIFTGERVRSTLLKSGVADRTSPTQIFLSALPPRFLLGLVSRVQIISMVGEDFRPRTGTGAPLF